MRRERVIVRVGAGPTWTSGPPENQPGWPEHERFIDDLVDRGTVVMGGPYSDYSGSLVLVEGMTSGEARQVFEQDPFVRNGVFVLEDVRDWIVYVDRLTSRS